MISHGRIFLLSLLSGFAVTFAFGQIPDNARCSSFRVMSFNIRFDNPGDSGNRWDNRAEMVASMIRFHDADLVGIQEALIGQLRNLRDRLEDYDWTGVGRDDGAEEGEFSAILFRKGRFNLTSHGTFWLSEKPGAPGPGWDAACNRVVTWGLFTDRITGRTVAHFNTHFDHMGTLARKESALLLKKNIPQLAGTLPVIVTGDLNCNDRSEPYRIITDTAGSPRLYDSYHVSHLPPHGPESSWSGFTSAGTDGERIDYIFVTHDFSVLRHGILSDAWGTCFPSDHMPVIAEIIFR